MNRVITIGREFGSGGRELGRRLAETLDIPYYDKEIISAIAEKSGFAQEYVDSIVEKNIFTFYPITLANSFSVPYELTTTSTIITAQYDIIKDLAEKSDCVIIGRCADYILRGENSINLFIYADMTSRIQRCREKEPIDEHLTDTQLKKKIISVDKNRAQYYEQYTNEAWGDKKNYHLCINTSNIVIKDLVPAIAQYASCVHPKKK